MYTSPNLVVMTRLAKRGDDAALLRVVKQLTGTLEDDKASEQAKEKALRDLEAAAERFCAPDCNCKPELIPCGCPNGLERVRGVRNDDGFLSIRRACGCVARFYPCEHQKALVALAPPEIQAIILAAVDPEEYADPAPPRKATKVTSPNGQAKVLAERCACICGRCVTEIVTDPKTGVKSEVYTKRFCKGEGLFSPDDVRVQERNHNTVFRRDKPVGAQS
jgi:hypothetical protein